MSRKPPLNDPYTSAVARAIDSNDLLSFKELWMQFWIRRFPFLLCLVLTPLIAILLTSLVPLTYETSARIMIRHEGAGASFFKEIVDSHLTISGQGAAEVIQSTPVIAAMVDSIGVTEDDLARPAFKVVAGKLVKAALALFRKQSPDNPATGELATARLAHDLKESLSAKTLLADRAGGKPLDEIIEISLESTNRLKGAEMVNELCRAFIRQHNLQFSEAALAAHQTLSAQSKKIESDINALRESLAKLDPKDLPAQSATGGSEYGALRDSSVAKPLVTGIANQLSQIELRVMKLRRIYKEDSEEVRRAQAELETARLSLYKAEAMDAARALLSSVQRNQRHALMAAELYRTNQTGIVLIEEALPPKFTKMAEVMHYLVPAAGGLALGGFLGLGLVIGLSSIDPKLYTLEQVERLTPLPGLAVLPSRELKKELPPVSQWHHKSAARTLCLLANRLRSEANSTSSLLLLGACGVQKDQACLSLQLAELLSQTGEGTLCLVDGSLEHATLSTSLGLQGAAGLNNWIMEKASLSEVITSDSSRPYDIIAAGHPELWPSAGARPERINELVSTLRSRYRLLLWHVDDLPDARFFLPLYDQSEAFLLSVRAGKTLSESVSQLPLRPGPPGPPRNSDGFILLT